MIIENIQTLTDRILQYNPYMDYGYADVQLVEHAERPGVFMVTNQGEFDFAMTFDNNFFYIRRNGAVNIGGNNHDGYTLSPKYKLFASAKDVDLYKFIECIFSTIGTFCTNFSIPVIYTEVEKTILDEVKKPEHLTAILSRFNTHKVFALDIVLFETFESYDVRKCNCNPCLNCAE